MNLKMQVFQAAVEAALAGGVAGAGTMEERLAATIRRRHGAGGPEERRTEWARDFLACLPAAEEARRLLILCYLPVYVCGCESMTLDRGRCDDCGSYPERYVFLPGEKARLCGLSKAFWGRIQDRRLFAQGMKIVERAA